jgi:hypothetical protein
MDADMTTRQIAATVRWGRKITFCPLDQDRITGYVAGIDREMLLVLVPRYNREHDYEPVVDKYLIHRGSTPVMELHDDNALEREEEPFGSEIRNIVAKFRKRIMTEFYAGVSPS